MNGIILLIWSLFVPNGVLSKGVLSQIVNGDRVNDVIRRGNRITVDSSEEFPSLVYVRINVFSPKENKTGESACGGIILEPNIVLTSAHCVEIPDISIIEVLVTAGAKNLLLQQSGMQAQLVQGYKVHENYVQMRNKWFTRNEYQLNDLAILWLKEEFQLTPWVQKANLAEEEVDVTAKIGITAGWGRTECGFYAAILRKTTLNGISNSACKEIYKNIVINKKMFCATSEDSKSMVSVGDSGGPFIYNDIVLGILSFGKVLKIKRGDGVIVDSCSPNHPALYTNLYSYRKWIKKALGDGPPTKVCKKYGRYCAL